MNENTVTSTELASLFDISVRQVQRLTLDGVISPVSDRRPYQYVLKIVCPQYCKFLQAKIATREKVDSIASLEEAKLQAEVDIKKSKAEAAKLELAELRGKMHRAEDVEAIFTDHVLFLRSLLLAMPGKLAVDLSGEHTAAEQAETVKREIYYILNNLADYRYDSAEYSRRLRERQGWEVNTGEEPVEKTESRPWWAALRGEYCG